MALKVSSQPFKSETDFKNYFKAHANNLEAVEGIWNVSTTQESFSYDTLYDNKSFSQTVAVIKSDSVFLTYDMKGGAFNVNFSQTGVKKVYLYRILLKEIDRYTKADAVITAGREMQYKYEFPEDYLHLILKNSFEQGDRVVNKVRWNKIFPN
jgi:hypothetical protein